MEGPGDPSEDSPPEPLHGIGGSLLAICAVFAVIGMLLAVAGKPVSRSAPDRAGNTAAARPTGTANPEPGRPRTTTPDAPTAVPTPPATPAATPPPPLLAPTPVSPPVATGPAATPQVPRGHVVVFNETRRRGLAAAFGVKLESEGWTLDGVGTWRGNVPATTVYYPPGKEATARLLMAEHPAVGRIRPVFPGISRTAITVIIAKDFPPESLAADVVIADVLSPTVALLGPWMS